MFKIYDGRTHFYQWDLDRELIIEDRTIREVHFCNRTDDCSLVCMAYERDGLWLVNVPNILLQTDWRINVYGYDGFYTKHSACFDVIKRTKPADYAYTETEVWNLEQALERAKESGDFTGPQGEPGQTSYLYTEVVDGELYIIQGNSDDGISFEINNNGELEVILQ